MKRPVFTLSRVRVWVINTLYVQLFLTLISWPILLFWGLPLSVLTIVGNVCFAPVIALFLGVSLGIFFCTLIGIPCAALIWVLETLTNAWLWVISWACQDYLYAFVKPSSALLWVMPLGALYVIYSQWGKNQLTGMLGQAALFILLCVVLKVVCTPRSAVISVPCAGRQVLLGTHAGVVFLVDCEGVLRKGAQSWVDFTLRPALIQQLGTSRIEVCIVMHPTNGRLRTVCDLARCIGIHTIMVPRGQADFTGLYSVDGPGKKLVFIEVDPQELAACRFGSDTLVYCQVRRVLAHAV